MAKIMPVTTTISGNEKSVGLIEVNQRAIDGKMHRYQLIYVPRNGLTSEFRIDMGLSSKYKGVRQLNIPSLLEHTVDELKDIANEIRNVKVDVKDLLQLEKLNLV